MNTEFFLVGMVMIFTVPFLVWRLGRTDFFAPLVVVQIICGILLGPGVLGAAFPDQYAAVFAKPVIDALSGIALWAVMLFVWIAGIELDLDEAWQHRAETGVTAGLALGMPLLFGCGAALLLLYSGPGWIGDAARPWQFVVGIGMACAVTALPILVLLMEKLEILREPLGQRILRYASIDDVAIWAVLAAILLDWERLGRQAGFLILFAIASYGLRRLLPRLAEPDRWYICLIWLAGCGLAADWAGLHYMVGAFLSGAVIDARWFDRARMDQFRGAVLLAFMPVFFLSTGLRTRWDVGGAVVFAAAGLLLAAAVAGKLAGTNLAGRLLKWQKGEAWLIGWLLQTKALIMIIFANILLDRSIITAGTFTALLLMAVASTMLTIPVVTPLLARYPGLRGKTR
ncbi:cation:proton antiporter [Sandarakinorhabdus sp.]|uniref:cation:proton antiporter n=1 Tax=Sandarakinorhabdus sp. TaxID=1916663 RepID=UPI00333F4922